MFNPGQMRAVVEIAGKEALAGHTCAARASRNRLLLALPDEAIALLDSELRQVSLEKGVLCFGQGEPINQVIFPETGVISLLVATGKGAVMETSSIGREGAVGMQCARGSRLSFTRATVQIAGKFSIIGANRFEQTAARSAQLHDLVDRYSETLWAEAQQLAVCNAIHDGFSRLCRRLLQSMDRIGSNQLLLTQDFLAEMLGVRRTTVTLFAQELRRRGVLRYSRGKITILDRPALEACACECYEVIKHDNLCVKIGTRL
jgi:CRP-like cAMP-binding protein